ncbi:M23 family metallopeptidase [Asticcacaulis sp. ZE23SCel15]|uniref:M23 family metallopeptidase n=1 Tax=Asticcacaulis sp. ZE23SCel15 TaxID=3059027 RepID=UPI00265DF69E|nr:M23 family metallopeptidase [Asticcacaulis sp. ZE23SCel15]WKL56147.1 M23 family metallopeptidase [Asticcacaulis sp. ZE23SCel15]
MIRMLFAVAVIGFAAISLWACDSPPEPAPVPEVGTETEVASEAASEVAHETSSEVASSGGATFPYDPPTQLIAGSGASYTNTKNWAPGICFPLADTPSYANSQVWKPGGYERPDNPSQCAPENYAYPWQDNFCETRTGTNMMCKTGTKGHQGQDIRPKTCKTNTYWAVAAEDGVVTQVASMTVAITGKSPPYRIYRYLHMQSSTLKVAYGDHVVRGQKLGLVSNNLGLKNGVQQYTTIHMHFEVRVAQAETLPDGTVLSANTFVPPYVALVDAYERKLGGDCPPVG